MKTSHFFLSLVSISLTVISARAASLDNKNEYIELPAFTVEAPRQSAAEKQIAQNLDEMRAAARKPLAVKTEVPLIKAQNEADRQVAKAAPKATVARS
jgi:hypothetical protein